MSEIHFEPERTPPRRALELIRVLTQPVRVKILRTMMDGTPMRVSDVAEAIGEAPNSVSYHLRQLEKAGLARRAEADPRRDGRETWWVVPAWNGLTFDISDISALPGGAAVLQSFEESRAQGILELFSLERAEAADRSGWPGISADGSLRLTHEEAAIVLEGLDKVFDQARAFSRAHAGRPDPGTRRYDYQVALLPTTDTDASPSPTTDEDGPAQSGSAPLAV